MKQEQPSAHPSAVSVSALVPNPSPSPCLASESGSVFASAPAAASGFIGVVPGSLVHSGDAAPYAVYPASPTSAANVTVVPVEGTIPYIGDPPPSPAPAPGVAAGCLQTWPPSVQQTLPPERWIVAERPDSEIVSPGSVATLGPKYVVVEDWRAAFDAYLHSGQVVRAQSDRAYARRSSQDPSRDPEWRTVARCERRVDADLIADLLNQREADKRAKATERWGVERTITRSDPFRYQAVPVQKVAGKIVKKKGRDIIAEADSKLIAEFLCRVLNEDSRRGSQSASQSDSQSAPAPSPVPSPAPDDPHLSHLGAERGPGGAPGLDEAPAFSYVHMRSELKRLLGRVLTILDAAVVQEAQNKALKSLVKKEFSERLSALWRLVHLGDGGDCENALED